MDAEKKNAIESLIQIIGKEFPQRNHVILVDMSTGSYRVDVMLRQEIVEDVRKQDHQNTWQVIAKIRGQRITQQVRMWAQTIFYCRVPDIRDLGAVSMVGSLDTSDDFWHSGQERYDVWVEINNLRGSCPGGRLISTSRDFIPFFGALKCESISKFSFAKNIDSHEN